MNGRRCGGCFPLTWMVLAALVVWLIVEATGCLELGVFTGLALGTVAVKGG